MASVFRGVLSFAAAAATGGVSYAARLLERGVSGARLRAQLATRYPRLRADSLENVAQAAIQARSAGRALQRLRPGQTLPLSQIPVVPGTPERIQVVVQLPRVQPAPGQSPMAPVLLNLPDLPGPDDLQEMILQVVERINSSREQYGREGWDPRLSFSTYQISTITRR